jgi:hypothetical protein
MINLTDDEIAEFQRLAAADGQILTRQEAVETATRVVLLYQRLARPTPSELRMLRAEALVVVLRVEAARLYAGILKRGKGRQLMQRQ